MLLYLICIHRNQNASFVNFPFAGLRRYKAQYGTLSVEQAILYLWHTHLMNVEFT